MSPVAGTAAASSRFASPDEAVAALCDQLQPVAAESLALAQATGRVLATAVRADRDSPPCDVSAMDGYAVRLCDLTRPTVDVAGEIAVGQVPPSLPARQALRIVTGAPVPAEAEIVIPREHVGEEPGRIVLRSLSDPPTSGLNIRRRGANLRAGQELLRAGAALTSAAVSGLASFGVAPARVRRKIRIGVVSTGNELVESDIRPTDWQIRDANGPGLRAFIGASPWLELSAAARARDDVEELRRALGGMLHACDAVLLTGGVSAGQYDFVPGVVAALGAKTVFHRLPLRPGGAILGAVGPDGQAILGLPGNPVSVLVTARRLARTVLRHLAGFACASSPVPVVRVTNDDGRTLNLWWYRLVRLTGPGVAELVPAQGSGDVVALARSDGFVEIPPHASGAGPWPYYGWEA